MSGIKWIKIVTDVFDDEKIRLIEAMPESDTIIVIWFKLLCLAGKHNHDGFIMITDKIAYTDEMLSAVFRRPLNSVRLALEMFEKFDMIQRSDDGSIFITNWDKHQNVAAMDRIREGTRKRVAAYRERKALSAPQSSEEDCKDTQRIEEDCKECNALHGVTCNTDVTECNENVTHIDKEEEKEVDRDIDSKKENNKKKEAEIPEDVLRAFNEFWSVYSEVRNDTRSEALHCFNARIKEGFEFEKIMACTRNYVDECKREKKERRWVLMPKTFLGPNLRFLAYEPTAPKKKSKDPLDGFVSKLPDGIVL